jgi:hypothetical protein
MKKITVLLGLCLTVIGNNAPAFNYRDSDLLLVFNTTYNGYRRSPEVVFDLGSISNYLNVANGTTVPVANWSLSEVTTNLNVITNCNFTLLAASSNNLVLPTLWVADALTNQSPAGLYAPRFQVIWSRINSYGLAVSQVTGNSVGNDYIWPTNLNTSRYLLYQKSEFAQAMATPDLPLLNWSGVAGGTAGPAIATLGANLKFPIQNQIPGSSAFFALCATNDPLPTATKIGTFQMDANGNLTFKGGSN